MEAGSDMKVHDLIRASRARACEWRDTWLEAHGIFGMPATTRPHLSGAGGDTRHPSWWARWRRTQRYRVRAPARWQSHPAPKFVRWSP